MRVLAIGDPHLSAVNPKPMTVFGPTWARHPEAFFEGWRRVVREGDLVLVPGDVSWAMRWDEARPDLEAIAALPGTKVLSRGNHDYWWPSIGRLRAGLPAGILAVQNDAIRVGEVIVGGTRGWICPGTHGFDDHDQTVYEREVGRLKLALAAMAAAGDGYRVVMLHFPPTNVRGEASGFTDALLAARPDALVFGHVHGDAPVATPSLPGTRVVFAAADRIGFEPVVVCEAADEPAKASW